MTDLSNQNKPGILLDVLARSKDATAIYLDDELHIDFANDAMIAVWGKDSTVIGKRLEDALPELKGQPFIGLLKTVWRNGETFSAKDTAADLEVNGILHTFYFDFEYLPLKDNEGHTYAILHTATEVTERVRIASELKVKQQREQELYNQLVAANKDLKILNEEYLTLNEEITVTNEELTSTNEEMVLLNQEITDTNEELSSLNEEYTALNEELNASNEELRSAYRQLDIVHDALAITEEKARLLLESAPVAVGVVNANTYAIDTANDQLLDLWNVDAAAIGQSIRGVFPTVEANFLINIIEAAKLSGDSVYGKDIERPAVADGESSTYFNFVYRPVKNKAGEVVSLQIVASDVTLQRNAKAVADAALEQLSLAKKATNLGVFDLDVKNDKLDWDDRCKELFGVDPQKEVTYTADFANGLHPDDREEILQAVSDTLNKAKTGGKYNVKYRTVGFADGRVRWLHAVGQAYFNSKDEPVRFIGTVMDITDDVTMRDELKNANLNLEIAIDAAKLGLWTANLKTGKMQVNDQYRIIFGLPLSNEITIQQILNAVDPEYLPGVKKTLDEAVTDLKDANILYPIINQATGERRWIKAVGRVQADENGFADTLVGIDLDVTEEVGRTEQSEKLNAELQEAVDQLTESEQRFKLMAEGTEVMIALGDETGAATYFNKAWVVLTGRSVNDLITSGWVDLMHPEDKERVLKIFNGAFEARAPWEWEFRMPDRSGGYKWLLARGTPRFRTDGSFAGYISATIDITERKEDEQRKNDFIGMVSHELKTPITSLSGYLQIMIAKARRAEDASTTGMLEKATKQVGKMTKMINGFLNVSRLESGKIYIDKQPFDMADLVQESEEESLAQFTSHNVVFAPVEYTPVIADRDKIGQVITNLISNAVKYSPQNSTIYVACLTANGLATVSVKDEGMGIAQEDIDKLFDRYYRVESHATKSISGFGIGLYLCKEIIDRHGGTISATSEVGKGSTFYFTIPVTKPE